jgi:hypothetical protein
LGENYLVLAIYSEMFPRILFGFGGKLSNIPLIFEGVPPLNSLQLGGKLSSTPQTSRAFFCQILFNFGGKLSWKG